MESRYCVVQLHIALGKYPESGLGCDKHFLLFSYDSLAGYLGEESA